MKLVFALSLLCAAQIKASAADLKFLQHVYPSDWKNRTDTLEFGTSAAVNGDWMFIGAEEYGQYWKDNETEDAGPGGVFIFRRLLNQRWVHHQTLEGYGKNSEFGGSVAVSGKHAIIGADLETVTVGTKDIEEQGAAYIFEVDNTDGKWKLMERVLGNVSPKSSGKFEEDEFGKSVAIDGQYAVVGAPEDEPEFRSEDGAVFVYRKDPLTGNWSEDAHLYVKDTEELGYSVDISGDTVIGGARTTVVNGVDNFGSAHVWRLTVSNSTREWKHEQDLICTMNDMQEDSYFGTSVAISGDYALVGGRKYDLDEGGVCFFQRVNGIWTQKQLIMIPDIVNRTSPDYVKSNFGTSVRLSGTTALIGAKHRGAFVYMIENNALVYKKALRCNNVNSPCDPTDDYFGLKLALGNNGEDAVVTNYHDKFGKPPHNGIGIEIGSANVFTLQSNDTTSAGSTSKSVSSMSPSATTINVGTSQSTDTTSAGSTSKSVSSMSPSTTTTNVGTSQSADTTSAGSTSKSVSSMSQNKTTTQGRQNEPLIVSSALFYATLAPALIFLSAVLYS